MKLVMPLAVAVACFVSLACQADAQSRRPEAEFETKPAAPSEADVAKFGLLKPTNVEESWLFEINGEGKGGMAIIGDAAIFIVSHVTGTNWHVQAYQTGLDLEEGKEYVVKFQLKSPEEIPVLLAGQIHEEDWHEIGLHEEFTATKEYKDYEFAFTARDLAKGNNRIGFALGNGTGIVYVKNFSLKEK